MCSEGILVKLKNNSQSPDLGGTSLQAVGLLTAPKTRCAWLEECVWKTKQNV